MRRRQAWTQGSNRRNHDQGSTSADHDSPVESHADAAGSSTTAASGDWPAGLIPMAVPVRTVENAPAAVAGHEIVDRPEHSFCVGPISAGQVLDRFTAPSVDEEIFLDDRRSIVLAENFECASEQSWLAEDVRQDRASHGHASLPGLDPVAIESIRRRGTGVLDCPCHRRHCRTVAGASVRGLWREQFMACTRRLMRHRWPCTTARRADDAGGGG